MRKLLVLLFPILLVGCQGGDAAPSAPAPVPPKPIASKVEAPGNKKETAIQLVNGDESVTVGLTSKAAFRVFPPAHEGDVGPEHLPEGFAAPYQAKTWETAGRGFGVILYDDLVIAAMYQAEQISDEAVEKMVQDHQSKLGVLSPEVIPGERVTYRFWELSGQRLMICALKNGKGSDVTIAMGDDVVMDGLGASPAQARTSIAKISQLLSGPKPGATRINP